LPQWLIIKKFSKAVIQNCKKNGAAQSGSSTQDDQGEKVKKWL